MYAAVQEFFKTKIGIVNFRKKCRIKGKIIANYRFVWNEKRGKIMPANELSFELDALLPKKFVDREELQKSISRSVKALLEKDNYHEVIAIFGMGGIGKSRFLNEVKESIVQSTLQKIEFIYATLELDNDSTLHSLLCIRRKISHPCYLFDYALTILLDRCIIEKISDDFLFHLQTNWVTDLVTLIQGTFPIPLPSLNDGVKVLTQLINKAIEVDTKSLYKGIVQQLETLSDTSPKKLLNLLPVLLGCDLHRTGTSRKLIVILDACNGCEGWINILLSKAKAGLFILTSREQMHLTGSDVKSYHMQEIPAAEAIRYLESYIGDARYRLRLIPQLVSVTECIPIYLDLAVSTYLYCKEQSPQNLIKSLSFNDKNALVEAFLGHLPHQQQEAILVLAIVGVFDVNVFEHLVSDLNLSASKLRYHELCRISLVDSLNTNCGLKTFHNIFRRSVSKIVSDEEKRKIFRSYLSFLSHRGPYKYANETLRTYFVNILDMAVENRFELTIQENEEILDLFFALRDQRVQLSFPNASKSAINNILLTFLSAVATLHSDVAGCLSKLDSIRSSAHLLGKHQNSYHAVRYYSMSIKGQYRKVKQKLAVICDALSSDAVMDWYYGKLKIYFADCLMLTGDFKEAITRFDEYYEEVEAYANIKENDLFEVQKQKGHCYRFNFLLDKAAKTYLDLYRRYATNTMMKSYCLTCLCEVKCFFDPQYVIDHHQESLMAAKAAGQERSRAKIFYSLGISYTVKRDFPNALHYIRESVKLNEQCNYPAGKMFAYIAKSYYCYTKTGRVPNSLLQDIVELSKQLEVYGYLLLPVYLMRGEEKEILQLKDAYSWLDWKQTRKNYEEFITTLAN